MDPGLAAILAALIAVGSGVIGSAVTLTATRRTAEHTTSLERVRHAREDARRHEETRRETYAAFLTSYDEALADVNEARRLGAIAPDMPIVGEGWHQELYARTAVLQVVGSPKAVAAAKAFSEAAQQYVLYVGERAAADPGDTTLNISDQAGEMAIRSDVEAKRNAYIAAVREDLGTGQYRNQSDGLNDSGLDG